MRLYKLLNNSGYAILALSFMMVTFISLVLIAYYPLYIMIRGDSGRYIAERNDYRFRKALFGETVDQCGTKLLYCGGLYSDDDNPGAKGTKSYIYQTRVVRRLYGTFGRSVSTVVGEGREVIRRPADYAFQDSSFWSGYRGKRYLPVLPSDKWDYTTVYNMDGKGHFTPYRPFRQPYAHIQMSAACASVGMYLNAGRGVDRIGFKLQNYTKLFINLKDYSNNRQKHDIRLIQIGSEDTISARHFFRMPDPCATFDDYILYDFQQSQRIDGVSGLAAETGQKKLMIQIKDNNEWITKDTRLLVIPEHTGDCWVDLIYDINYFG